MVLQKLSAFVQECKRVLTVTKKPTKSELLNISKISAIGMLLIGIIGFLMFMLKMFIMNLFGN